LSLVLNSNKLAIKAELTRKCIHLGSSVIPLSYFYLFSREQILYFTCFIAIGFIIAEFTRFRISFCDTLFRKIFYNFLREDEKKENLTGATYLFLAMCMTLYLFPKKIAVPALFMLTIADSSAAIVGKILGKHKFFLKTIEGSTTFFLIAMILLFIFVPQKGFMLVLIALLITIIEALPIAINDNLLIPLSTGCFLMIL
jgi:dolichol kinase